MVSHPSPSSLAFSPPSPPPSTTPSPTPSYTISPSTYIYPSPNFPSKFTILVHLINSNEKGIGSVNRIMVNDQSQRRK
jgi:hypothetical protein